MIASLIKLGWFFGFALALIHGMTVVVRWWRGLPLQAWEYGLLVAFPLLLYFFITRYSIFRKACTACDARLDKHD